MPELPFDVSSQDVLSRLNDPQYLFLDVREVHEFDFGHLSNAKNLPLSTLTMGDFDSFDKQKIFIVVCRTGGRSRMVTDTLRKMGMSNVQNLAGGLVGLNMVLKEKIPVLMY